MSWKDGQAPALVWLSRKDVGAKKTGAAKHGTRLCCGNVLCWTMEPLHAMKDFACYRLVPSKSKREKKK